MNSDGNGKKTFGEFLNEKFHEYQGKNLKGGIKSQNDWARYLGVSPTSLSVWRNDIRKPMGTNIDKLANKLGEEVYLILGVTPRMPTDKRLQMLVRIYRGLSPSKQDQLYETALNLEDENDEGQQKNNP